MGRAQPFLLPRAVVRRRLAFAPAAARRRCQSTATTPAPPAARLSIFASALAWYSKKLDTHPLLTKGITSGVIGGAGDLLCQAFIDRPEKECERLQNGSAAYADESIAWWWDGWRTARFCFLGAFYIAPGCHYWYGGLASRYPLGVAGGTSNSVMVAQRVAWDQFAFTPFFLVGWIASLWMLEDGVMSGKPAVATTTAANGTPPASIPTRLIATVPDILVANWILWVPVQALNFRFTPTKFQVLVSNCVALVWNSYLSFSTRTKTPCENAAVQNNK